MLDIPVYATTQKREVLGDTVAEVGLESLTHVQYDKTSFSMCIPELMATLPAGAKEVVLIGIESHICVLLTGLDLLAKGYKVFILADGVSSCNKEEIPIALRRLASQGAIITTSESFLYELMGDATIPEFRAIAGLVKESKESTSSALQALCKI